VSWNHPTEVSESGKSGESYGHCPCSNGSLVYLFHSLSSLPFSSLAGDGTVFIVSFTPTEYGKTQVGKLVIQTEEMQWTYEIRGIPPEYIAPEGAAVVASRMDKSLTKNLGKSKRRNFVGMNMNVSKRVAEDKAKRYGKGKGKGSRRRK